MKICSSCGKQFDDQMVFCPMCGRGLTGMLRPPQETKTDPHLGAVIDGKYRLDQKIGTGGMGIVYKATHLHMHSTVAVKLLNTTLVSDEHAVERFRREAQAAARIQHPNAVSVTDFGVTPGGEVYIVMEYLEGSDLRERLKSQKRIGAEEAIRIMVQVLGAVHKAHARGVIHRDLKPDNVWITQEEDTGEERVKVLDFGIAKLKNQTGGAALTQHGMMVGTPHYMSPEQVNGAELDARSDVYAAGIMLYEMLCGTRPFEAGTPFAVAMMHLTQKPQSLSEVNPEVPAQLAAAVMRAIEKEPADRPATAAEFAASLLDALRASTGQSVSLPSGAFASPDTSLSPDRSFPPERARLATPQTPHPTTPTPTRTETPVPAPRTLLHDARADSTKTTRAAIVAIVALAGLALAAVVIVAAVNWTKKQDTTSAPPRPDAPSSAPPTAAVRPPDGMVHIPGGTFEMGTDDTTAPDGARPAFSQTVRAFFLDSREVTNDEYRQFVEGAGRRAPSAWPGGKMPADVARLPVTGVTWEEASAFAASKGKRLPTEAEWEYAARGPDGNTYVWGDDWRDDVVGDELHPVGSVAADRSKFDVFDMAGNASEWTSSDLVPYPKSTYVIEAEHRFNKMFRGGNVRIAPNKRKVGVAAWYRQSKRPDQASDHLGFRCAQDVPN